jgi:hypothetical protein
MLAKAWQQKQQQEQEQQVAATAPAGSATGQWFYWFAITQVLPGVGLAQAPSAAHGMT